MPSRIRARARRSFATHPAKELDPLLRLWVLRMLVLLNGHSRFVLNDSFADDELACALDLGDWVELRAPREFDRSRVLQCLRRRHREAEASASDQTVPATLTRNVVRLGDLAGLCEVDRRVCEFAALLHTERLLEQAADYLGEVPSSKISRVLSVVLGLPEPSVRRALAADGVLAQSGLVSLDRTCRSPLSGKLDLLSPDFADRVVSGDDDPVSLLRGTASPASPPELGLGDFVHLNRSLAVLRRYLQRALAGRRRGVNVFLWGPPGTGKSQLARILAAELGCELFEIAAEDAGGDPIRGEARLRALRAAQCFFAQRQALILFEEVEDVFSDGNHLFGVKSTAQTRKAWVNRTLEENPIPTLWVSNSARCLDPAFVRRFDLVVELPVPPLHRRLEIVTKACEGLLPRESLGRVAACEVLSPASVVRAACVVSAVQEHLEPGGAARALEDLLCSTLEAQGHPPLRREDPSRLPDHYDLGCVNATTDLNALAEGIRATRSGRLCLYGPSGTGKTAFGRWLAERLGVPFHVKKGSDLLSMWVGGTEQNIAGAFREAERDGALLLFDEVDGFLQDRRRAHRSWEVTAVNEMLTQMEGFPGVFVASTNLMEDLDPAALRRFDLKVGFDYLTATQAWQLFGRQCEVLGFAAPKNRLRGAVGSLALLAPGDFAAVARRHRFQPLGGPADLLEALRGECALKEGETRRAIGFL